MIYVSLRILTYIKFTDVNSFQLINNQIEHLNGDSFQMRIQNAINIQRNTFNSMSSSALRCKFK